MTENKRFKTKEELINHLKSIENDRYIITIACEYLDTKTDEWLSIEQVFERLNSLNDENEQLKGALKELKEIGDYQEMRIQELGKENEQLKQEYNKLKHRHSLLHDVCIEAECDRDSYHKDVLSLEKENEQLKQLVDEAEDIIVCQCTPHYQRKWDNIKKNIKGDVE